MTKTMHTLPMDTRDSESSCGGPPEYIDTNCPQCGKPGRRVKRGTVRHLLNKEFKGRVQDNVYGLCLSADCDVAWYAQAGTHHFKTNQIDTSIWTKSDTAPVMACYCNEITKEMVFEGVHEHGLHNMQSIIRHFRGEIQSKCAVRNPEGRCCTEAFNVMIKEAQAELEAQRNG